MAMLGVPMTRVTTTVADAPRFRRSRPATRSVFAPLVSGTSTAVKLPVVSLARMNCAGDVPTTIVDGSRLLYVPLTVIFGVPVVVFADGALMLTAGASLRLKPRRDAVAT